MNTMCPRPRSTIPGAIARARAIGARRLVSSMRSICSWVSAGSAPRAGGPRRRGADPVDVSADAPQGDHGRQVLTGAADAQARTQLAHRLISLVPVDATFSAGQYAELAHAEIDTLLAAGRRPIVVGGTGLYLRAALAELDLRPPSAATARARWSVELHRQGAPALHEQLARRAPWAAQEIAPHD